MKSGKTSIITQGQKFYQNCSFLSILNTKSLTKVKQLQVYRTLKKKKTKSSLCLPTIEVNKCNANAELNLNCCCNLKKNFCSYDKNTFHLVLIFFRLVKLVGCSITAYFLVISTFSCSLFLSTL